MPFWMKCQVTAGFTALIIIVFAKGINLCTYIVHKFFDICSM